MSRTPGFVLPSAYPVETDLEEEVRRRDKEAGFVVFDPDELLTHADKPPLDEALLNRFGVNGSS